MDYIFYQLFLNQKGFIVDSLEPGGFSQYIITSSLEQFSDENISSKYDFIFSINVLEHTKDTKTHIKKCLHMLLPDSGLLSIRCPNYLFPFETHFYKFFIPFFPRFTFEKLQKKKLIRSIGKNRYFELLKHINFNCDYIKN